MTRRRSGLGVAVLALAAVLVGGCAGLGDSLGRARDKLLGPSPAAPGARTEVPRGAIDVAGVAPEIGENVRAHLALAAEPCDAPRWRLERRFARSEREVERALRAYGHYRPRIEKRLEAAPGCWRAVYRIEPGPRVSLAAVDVRVDGEARGDEAFAALLGDLPIAPGDPLDHRAYEDAKRRLQSLAAERGYLDARFTRSELRVDVAAGRAEAILHLDSGRRYRFGALTVEQDVLDPDLVARLFEDPAGQPYDAARVARIHRDLADSGYFESVEVRPRLDRSADGAVPVEVRLRPRKRHGFSVGLGVTTDTGPRVRGRYENRRLNARGHRLEAGLLGSLVEREASAEYSLPLADPRTEWLSLRGGISRVDTDTSRSDALRLGVRQTRQRPAAVLETRFLDFTRESFDVSSVSRSTTLIVPGLAWSQVVSDGGLRPARGHRWNVELAATHTALGSDAAFARVVLGGGLVRALPGGGRLLLRAEAGALVTDDFDALPPSRRFFAGGDRSVRGYDFQALGPEDAAGEVVGGRYLGVVSVEYEHPIRGPWSAAAFVDAGNAFDDGFDNAVAVGVGAGVRWSSPVGPIGVDLAHPLADGEPLLRLHLRIGPEL